MKYDKKELCEKRRSIYPEIGECGIDVGVEFDDKKNAWIVDLRKGKHYLKTHLEPSDAGLCLEGKQCIYLGSQITQLGYNQKVCK
jgi:hypothetical protein